MAKKKKKASGGNEAKGGDGVDHGAAGGSAKEGALLDQLLLKERVKEMEEKNRALSQTNASLSAKLVQQQQDQADVFFHLHRKIDQSQEKIQALEDARAIAREEAVNETESLRNEIKALVAAAKTRASAHDDEVFGLRQELMELNEFAKHKTKYEAKIESLERALEAERSQRTLEVADMELEKVREKERLKKDMLIKIKETKKALLRLTEDQLETTTKRTILENEQLATELQYQSRETEKLLARLGNLERDNAVLRRKLDLVNTEKLGHARKANLYLKLSQTLQEQQAQEENQHHRLPGEPASRRISTEGTAAEKIAVHANGPASDSSAHLSRRISELLRTNRHLQSDLSSVRDALHSTARVVDAALTEYDLEHTLKSTLQELLDCLRSEGEPESKARAGRLRGLLTRRKVVGAAREPLPAAVWQQLGCKEAPQSSPISGGLPTMVYSPTRPPGRANRR